MKKKNLNFLTHCGITLLGSVQCIKACWIIIVYDEKNCEFYFWSCNILAAIKCMICYVMILYMKCQVDTKPK